MLEGWGLCCRPLFRTGIVGLAGVQGRKMEWAMRERGRFHGVISQNEQDQAVDWNVSSKETHGYCLSEEEGGQSGSLSIIGH